MSVESVRRALGVYHPRRVAYKGARWGRLCAERWALAAWQRAAASPSPTRRGRILTYHSIGTPEYGLNDLRPRDFERHLQIAVDDGWSFTTPAEVIAEPDKPQLALTFDDGLASVLANALPVLRHHGIPATAFVVTGWADGRIPDSYRRIVLDWRGVSALQEGGMTLASHSVTHSDFGRLSPVRRAGNSRSPGSGCAGCRASRPASSPSRWASPVTGLPPQGWQRPRPATRRYTRNASATVPREPSRARSSPGLTGQCCSARRWPALTTTGKSGTDQPPIPLQSSHGPGPRGRASSRASRRCYLAGVGADTRSMAANSSSLSSSERAPEFSRTCSGLAAPGIGIT